MKKIIAVLLLLCLSLCPALAENAVNWADVEPTLAENGLEGHTLVVGLCFWAALILWAVGSIGKGRRRNIASTLNCFWAAL